ncbi:uncharacterized protein LOC110343772 isoform X2 [Mesocricetus auratus]|uniref:Uncharacterized protein LOC110343772 isoform X2 n=1 Tax=Mesocricetus auratus TaxID=10036 RepID=A0ABM2X4W0_MESAU|nr:uncharacterized protein LOC110343772 isoform X2 [Mesocricetus auratus]
MREIKKSPHKGFSNFLELGQPASITLTMTNCLPELKSKDQDEKNFRVTFQEERELTAKSLLEISEETLDFEMLRLLKTLGLLKLNRIPFPVWDVMSLGGWSRMLRTKALGIFAAHTQMIILFTVLLVESIRCGTKSLTTPSNKNYDANTSHRVFFLSCSNSLEEGTGLAQGSAAFRSPDFCFFCTAAIAL